MMLMVSMIIKEIQNMEIVEQFFNNFFERRFTFIFFAILTFVEMNNKTTICQIV